MNPASEREPAPWAGGIIEAKALGCAGGSLELPFSAPACLHQVSL